MSNRRELEKSWNRTRAHLGRAAAVLPPSPVQVGEGGRLDRYHDWIRHNELELALDELEGLGDNNPVPLEFWAHLRDAALEMRLGDRVTEFERKLSESAG